MNQSSTIKENIYTKQGLWSLFLMCAFPLHLWTLILAIQDISWVSERTNSWDAVGVVSYGMLFALLESIFVFAVFTLVGLVTPRRWNSGRRVGFLILLVLILSIWGMIGQLLFLWNINLPWAAILFLARSGHPLRYLYAGALTVVVPTVILPIYAYLRSDRMLTWIEDIADRISLLTGLYLFFDVLGIIIIIIRNI